jgi:hypothetical protein
MFGLGVGKSMRVNILLTPNDPECLKAIWTHAPVWLPTTDYHSEKSMATLARVKEAAQTDDISRVLEEPGATPERAVRAVIALVESHLGIIRDGRDFLSLPAGFQVNVLGCQLNERIRDVLGGYGFADFDEHTCGFSARASQ